MESALSHLFVGDNLVHLAAAIYLAGFLFRDQIMLRPPDRGRCREHRLLRVFIGEVSLLLTQPASATVAVAPRPATSCGTPARCAAY
jgi:hypothetical protein